jgi:hypothetical protein
MAFYCIVTEVNSTSVLALPLHPNTTHNYSRKFYFEFSILSHSTAALAIHFEANPYDSMGE